MADKLDASHGRSAPAYLPAHEYHAAIPQVPQTFLVPPMALGDKNLNRFIVEPPEEHGFDVGEFVDSGFFNQVDQSWFSHRAKRETWLYAMRREAQQILPFLYLGPSSVSKDQDFLRREGITLLLSIRDRRSANVRLLSGAKVAEELGILADSVDVEGEAELIASFPNAIRRINKHITSGASAQQGLPPRVLVFCEAGNERSASVVIAYVMAMFNMTMANAMWTVQHRRFCINVDESMQSLLRSFETILEAKRQVAAARRQESLMGQSQPLPQSKLLKKRSFIEYDNDQQHSSGPGGNLGNYSTGMSNAEDSPEHLKQKPAPFVDRVV
ncbi:protein-tyrosine phosphatase-like protein [Talaromyces proteolyticus]|uniref:Protein-tyrosine phosphatase-like protein n=1 Tax=Talaromyces proteolyticus TaxID=1131652 RepID=A0AAD4Q195_9EURO|nr:protein-tyrosine phosphatase-like protein [Talaromyces proteolyticus]KAH8698474.1 protein-tyrosine phosphatase-like protein [Talaromyces proteolyticus]